MENVTKKQSDNNNIRGPCCDDILTIRDSSRLIFFVSKFFGFSLFALPKVNLTNHKICRKFQIETTFINIVILTAVVTVYTYLIYYNTTLTFKLAESESIILTVGAHVCLMFGLIVSIISMLVSFVQRGTVFKIFIHLCYIDILLENFYETFVVDPLKKRVNIDGCLDKTPPPIILQHKRQFQFSVIVLLVGFMLIVLDMVVAYVLNTDEFTSIPLVFVSYALQNASFLIITLQTMLFLLVIKTRYAALNKLICSYLTLHDSNSNEAQELYDSQTFSKNQIAVTPMRPTFLRNGYRFDKKIIAKFAQTHDKLNDIVEWVNRCYAVQSLGVVAVSFGYDIFTFFSLYYAIYRPDKETAQMAAAYMTFYIFYLFCVMSLVIASSAVTNEGGKTGVLLHKSINEIIINSNVHDVVQSNEIIKSLRIFSLQLQKRSPIVSCGLFTYDWSLFFSIIAASATYLIILIQFDSSMGSKTCGTNHTINGTLK